MAKLLSQILMFVALLLAPLTMSAASAAPAHGSMGAGSAMEHCPDADEGAEPSSGMAECAMGCAAALPAIAGEEGLAVDPGPARAVRAFASRLASLHPDIATPPPKRA